jgi:hypothetical protein
MQSLIEGYFVFVREGIEEFTTEVWIQLVWVFSRASLLLTMFYLCGK